MFVNHRIGHHAQCDVSARPRKNSYDELSRGMAYQPELQPVVRIDGMDPHYFHSPALAHAPHSSCLEGRVPLILRSSRSGLP
jgi:hypothetical protein